MSLLFSVRAFMHTSFCLLFVECFDDVPSSPVDSRWRTGLASSQASGRLPRPNPFTLPPVLLTLTEGVCAAGIDFLNFSSTLLIYLFIPHKWLFAISAPSSSQAEGINSCFLRSVTCRSTGSPSRGGCAFPEFLPPRPRRAPPSRSSQVSVPGPFFPILPIPTPSVPKNVNGFPCLPLPTRRLTPADLHNPPSRSFYPRRTVDFARRSPLANRPGPKAPPLTNTSPFSDPAPPVVIQVAACLLSFLS